MINLNPFHFVLISGDKLQLCDTGSYWVVAFVLFFFEHSSGLDFQNEHHQKRLPRFVLMRQRWETLGRNCFEFSSSHGPLIHAKFLLMGLMASTERRSAAYVHDDVEEIDLGSTRYRPNYQRESEPEYDSKYMLRDIITVSVSFFGS